MTIEDVMRGNLPGLHEVRILFSLWLRGNRYYYYQTVQKPKQIFAIFSYQIFSLDVKNKSGVDGLAVLPKLKSESAI